MRSISTVNHYEIYENLLSIVDNRFLNIHRVHADKKFNKKENQSFDILND